MKINNTPGIYKIVNSKNGKFYIGSSVNIRKRKHVHFSALKKGNHHSQYLQNAWNKYGESAFTFEVLELCEKEALLTREQYYMDEYKPQYNIAPIAGNCLGIKRSKTVVERMSEHQLQKTNKRVGQYDLSNNLIREFRSAIDAAKFLGKDRTCICKCCNGIHKTVYGYIWKYV